MRITKLNYTLIHEVNADNTKTWHGHHRLDPANWTVISINVISEHYTQQVIMWCADQMIMPQDIHDAWVKGSLMMNLNCGKELDERLIYNNCKSVRVNAFLEFFLTVSAKLSWIKSMNISISSKFHYDKCTFLKEYAWRYIVLLSHLLSTENSYQCQRILMHLTWKAAVT